MPTRQEFQTGHDLIVLTDRINQSRYLMSLQLQGIIAMRVAITLDEDRLMTSEEVKASVALQTKTIRVSHADKIVSFQGKAKASLSSNGLGHYGIQQSTISNDVSNAQANDDALLQAIDNVSNAAALRSVGERLERELVPELPAGLIIKMPDAERYTNICNDCLDTAAYELRNINPYTGVAMMWTVAEMKVRIPDRFKVVRLRQGGVAHDDSSALLQVANQAAEAIKDANTLQDMLDLSALIAIGADELPLIRRDWAL